MRFLRKLLTYVVVLALLIVGAGVGVFYLTPSSTITSLAGEQVREATGRDLTIDGEIKRSLFPVLGFETERFAVANADWAAEGAFVEARAASFKVKFMPLLMGRVDIEEIRLVEPKLRLEIAEDGRKNWDFAGANPREDRKGPRAPRKPEDVPEAMAQDQAASARDALQRLSLKVAEIQNAEIFYIDRASGQTVEMKKASLTVSLPSYDATLILKGSAEIQGRTATVDGAFDSPKKIGSGETAGTDFKLSADGIDVAYNGRVKAPTDWASTPEVEGEFSLRLDGDPAKTAWLRTLAPALERVGAVNLKGVVKIDESVFDARVDGQADVNKRPTVLAVTAKAGSGWYAGDTPVEVDASVKNALLDAGYKGQLGRDAGAVPLAKGAYRIKAPNVRALLAWSGGPGAQGPLARLESVDVTGAVDYGAQAAKGAVNGQIRFGGRAVTISGEADGGPGWAPGAPVKSRLDVTSPRFFTLSWAGSTPTDPNQRVIDGAATFETDALRDVIEWASGQRVSGPRGAFRTMRLDAAVKATPDTASAELKRFQIDQSTATGSVQASGLRGRPNVTATLKSGPLDLRPFEALAGSGGSGGGASAGRSGGGGGSAAGGGPRGGWSDAPIDYGPLKQMDATFDIEVGGLRTTQFALGASRVLGTLKGGKLDVDIQRIGLYGGAATGKVTVDASGDPSIGADVKASGVQLRPVLRDFANSDRLEGTGAVSVQIAGPARSMRQLMTSMDGKGAVELVDGAILGIDIPGTLRRLANPLSGGGAQRPKTDFASITASFAIKDGVASNDDLAFLGPLLRMSGAGTINVGQQSMNYRAVPRLVASLEGQGGRADTGGIAVPVVITGPWSNLSYAPDLSGLIEDAISNPGALLDGVLGGGDGGGGGVQGVVEGLLPGGGGSSSGSGGSSDGGGGGSTEDAVKGVVDGLLPGGDGEDGKKPDVGRALKGLFGN